MLEARNVGRFANMLVQITIDLMSDDLRLRRLLCGKALPFRRTSVLKNLYHEGWKAEPSSLRGGGKGCGIGRKGKAFPQGRAAEPHSARTSIVNLDCFDSQTAPKFDWVSWPQA
jgi:hypothetical protein